MNSAIRSYVRTIDRMSDLIGTATIYIIYVMVAVLLFDVITNRFLNMTQIWTTEFAQFALAAYYFLAGPVTMKNEDHVRLDLVYSRLGTRGRARIDAVTIWVVIFYLGILLWGGISSTLYSFETNQRLPSLWAPSVVPIKLLMCVCLVLMILQSLSIFFRDLARRRGGDIA